MTNIFQNDYNSTTLVLKNIEDMNYEYLFMTGRVKNLLL